ncbi:MAG: hypothetical protein D3903_02740, partial [Candidatus Electrothrix sp. GM3_4]|nr:hypothetical protein [Candidatus Electrothrix sp. GM3_4]
GSAQEVAGTAQKIIFFTFFTFTQTAERHCHSIWASFGECQGKLCSIACMSVWIFEEALNVGAGWKKIEIFMLHKIY